MFADGGFDEKFGSFKCAVVFLAATLVILVPIVFIFVRFGMQEFIRAAFMWAVVLASVVYVSKEQRRKLWFWVTLLVCTSGHFWLADYYLEGVNGAPLKLLAFAATMEVMALIVILAIVEAKLAPVKNPAQTPQENSTSPKG